MADHLHRLRRGLIDGCNKALIKGLLDDLLEEKILNDGEVEYIDEGNTLSSDKMRALIDTVRKKGNKSSNIMIQKVSKRDSMLSEKLGITAPTEYPLPKQETKIESPSQKKYSFPKQETKVMSPSQKTPSDFPLPLQEQKVEPPSQTAPSEFPLPLQEQRVGPPCQTDSNGITLCLQEEYERICSIESNNKYPILPRKERTRLALIICNEKFDNCYLKERCGAEHDVNGMEKLLEGLGYKVFKRTNLTVREMRDTMRMFAAEQEHITSDSTFLVFMSHGQRDVICGTDTQIILNEYSEEETNNVLHVDEIFATFNNVNCRVLQDKPKVIIIQACRGRDSSQVLVGDGPCALPSAVQENLEDDGMRMLQKERDFICFCSTTPDTVSWRQPQKGSLFIQRLIEHMKKDAHHYSIEDIFRNVQFSFKDKVQMPTQERKTLLKKFYLFPGH